MQKVTTLINNFLRLFGVQVIRMNSQKGFWSSNTDFVALYKKTSPHTLVGPHKSYMLYQYARYAARHLKGDVAQLGVYKGGSAQMIADCFKGTPSKVFLFDTFEGLPGDAEGELGMFGDVAFTEVQKLLALYPNVEFKKGFFPDTAKGLEHRTYSFVYLDGDMYQSMKDGLDFFYPRLVPGGIIMCDDYESPKWVGVKKAVQEFSEANGVEVIHTAWWQCAIVKPPHA